MKQLYSVDRDYGGGLTTTTTRRSVYILDGALGNELDVGSHVAPSFSMELLYLLLPIVGAFLLLFSVCCCGKTLKKMLHIPKVVVMGSYAAMQLENQNPHRRNSTSDESSSSDDDDDDGHGRGDDVEEDEQDEEEMRRRAEDHGREMEIRRNMLEARSRSMERDGSGDIRELWEDTASQQSLMMAMMMRNSNGNSRQHLCHVCDRESMEPDVESGITSSAIAAGRRMSSYDSPRVSHRDSLHRDSSYRDSSYRDSSYRDSSYRDSSYRDSSYRDSSYRDSSYRDSRHSDNQVVSVVIHENSIFNRHDFRQFESDSNSVVVCHSSGEQTECDNYPHCTSTGNSCQCKTVSRPVMGETDPCVINPTNTLNPATQEDLNYQRTIHDPDTNILDPDFKVIVHDPDHRIERHDTDHRIERHDQDHRIEIHDSDTIIEEHENPCNMSSEPTNNNPPQATGLRAGRASRPNTLLELNPRLLENVAAQRSNRSLQASSRRGYTRNSIRDRCSRLKRLKNPLNQHRGHQGTDNDMFRQISADDVPVTSQSCPLLPQSDQ